MLKWLRHTRNKGSQQDLGPAADAGEKTPWDIPLIRVAAKKGAYWYHDQKKSDVRWCELFGTTLGTLGSIGIQAFRSFWD